jgi:hypothetical protein
MSLKTYAGLLSVSVLLAQGCAAPEAAMHSRDLPTYTCRRIDRDLVLSGKADDPLWQRAEAVALGEPIEGKPNRYRTAARLLYNGRFLYIAFDCEDEYVWGTHDQRDAPIYEQECVEAFLCPSGKTRQYYEINVSPRNTVFDAVILNGRSAPDGAGTFKGLPQYTCEGLVTKVHVRGELGVKGAQGWSAEFAIPFASIPGSDNPVPKPGDAWRFNLYRIDSPEPPKLEFYAWSPTGANDYHRPWRFGMLVFR